MLVRHGPASRSDAWNFSQEQDSFEGLRGGVRDRPGLFSGAKAPAALNRLPKVTPVPVRQAPHLLLDEPAPGSRAHVLVGFHHASLNDGLHREGGVPSHRAVVALHLHAVLGDPHVRRDPGQMGLERATFAGFFGLRLAPSGDPGNEDVEGLADRANGQVVRLQILGVHVLQGKVAANFPQPLPGPKALVDQQHVLHQSHDRMDRTVVVDVGTAVHVLPPRDLAVLLPPIEFRP
mmetsp:Transcript_6645/g.15642  ORF Transcript_6645/g.15642 Transcript_6645/m.15642 type:complete len:234 (+) Transcript_6645:991-1692(+)